MRTRPLMTLITSAAIAAAAALSVPSVSLSAATGRADAASRGSRQESNRIYIVRMAEDPVATYDGRIRGYAATRPAEGGKIDAASPDTQNYRRYLSSRHDATISRVGGRKIYSYELVFNGFAAQLTEAQAAKLASTPGVLSVVKDELRTMDTSHTPAFLGLTDRGGLWDQLGGARDAGDGIVVGIVDSGIWPENPSFAGDDRHGHGHGGPHDHHRGGGYGNPHGWDQGPGHIHGWTGYCEDGENFDGDDACNGKIIGARYFNEGWGGDAGIDALRPWEFNSPRDYNSHGSHTSSTAAGNYKVKTDGPPAALGRISGMAPGARIAVYKALWSTQSTDLASGYDSDLVAAIDQAVADGVDVINYSISGSQTNFLDPVELAFLSAADAGVFVAASAGNSGPTSSTVAHPSPWITTVAAGTHDRSIQGGSATLGNGTTYNGVGYLLTAGPVPMVDAGAVGLAGADPATLALCLGASDDGVARLDPAKVAGKIVVCNRGLNVLVNKAKAVKDAGGAGMVLVNTPTSNTTLPFVAYSIPAVHLPVANYADIKAYAATAGATATINAADIVYTTPAPFTATFSSRGPLRASFDLLKPDLIAPGQDILAAVSPAVGGLNFDLFSGTSMSSPHVAGLAALLKDLKPKWSPMMIKSALMTTAYDVLDGPNTDPLVIFRQGAGHVTPNKAADPGLVFDSRWNDWVGFLCGTQLDPSYCTGEGIPVLDPSNFNTPSIAIGDLAGAQTVTRTLTNVGWRRATYSSSVTGLAGFTVTVSPSTFTINPNNKQKVSIKIQRTTAPLNAYTGGYVTWSDGDHQVRIPVVVQPVALGAPAQVSGSYSVKFGYDGAFSAKPRGLVAATTFADTVAINDYNVYPITVPAGTTYARFSLFDANVSPGGSDLDLEVYDAAFNFIGSSGGATAAEEVNFRDLAAGLYYVLVVGYAAPSPATSVDYTLFTWLLGSTSAGNMSVTAPTAATTGATGAVNLAFSGLAAGTKYLGSVAYDGVAGLPNPTIVRVDTP